MNRRYQFEAKGTGQVSEILTQMVKAAGIKIKRYGERCIP